MASFVDLKASLYTAVLSDVLDGMGYMHQAMRPFVRPLDDSLKIMGRARTGLWMNVYAVTEGENPYEHEIALIDDLKPGDVAVFGCGGPTDRVAPWGELLSTAATCRGAEGCVTDGLVRDVRQIREMKFPVFHGGIGPLDSRGRAKLVAIDVPTECGGVRVAPGDIVFGDVDGVVIIPATIADEAIALAEAKVAAENRTRDALLRGELLQEVYARFGVL
jgi:4-hydroxy-4-methyl-2-oxoglutarate aldolase